MNCELPSSEVCEIQDLGSLHHYRTEIPNIIFEMDLDPYEFKTYCVLKRTAGDKGSCFKSTDTLCKEVGCQKPKLIDIKNSLVTKGLITLTKRKHENGGNMPDLITIIHIWEEIPDELKDQMLKAALDIENHADNEGGCK